LTDMALDADAGDNLCFRLAARGLSLGANIAVTEKWEHGNVNMAIGDDHHSNIIVRICVCLYVLDNNTFITMRFNNLVPSW
jgi:hypothetical protein